MREGWLTAARDPHSAVHGVLWDLALSDIAGARPLRRRAARLYTKVAQPVVIAGGAKRALVYFGANAGPGNRASRLYEGSGRRRARARAARECDCRARGDPRFRRSRSGPAREFSIASARSSCIVPMFYIAATRFPSLHLLHRSAWRLASADGPVFQPMRFIETFNFLALVNSAVCLAAAFIFGTLIGAERQYRQRSAGLRTNVLVAVGAAAFVDFGIRVAGPSSTQVMAYVVSGIGFLGAGAIMKEGANVRGLNTAATLWCSAAVGAAAGAGLVAESALLTVFVIAGNTLLRPLVNRINRAPLNEEAGEATYEVRLSAAADTADAVREALIETLESAHYPVADVETRERGEDMVEVVATLVTTAITPDELDAVVETLENMPGVDFATWESERKA